MSETPIHIEGLGKMYKLFRRPADKVLDAFGLLRWLPHRRKTCQEFWALRGIDLQVHGGERLGIIGRNGAGKSTLLKIITGNVSPTEGTVKVRGRIQALMELGTGFHPEFTGRENIWAALSYQGLSPSEIRSKEEEIIDFAEIEDFIHQPVKTYSAGMYARLAFSTATAIEPEILIVDEVLGAGDAYFSGKCVERMRNLTETSGATVLFVSHDLGSVQRLCNRVIWIDRGRIHRSGEPLEIIKQYSAVVRKEEEVRLKARDLKILKRHAQLLDTNDDIYDKMLFHFLLPDGASSRARPRIYKVRLLVGSEEVGVIEVGSPMDNSPDHLHYLMDTPGYMNWGPPRQDEHGMYREYCHGTGKYGHAPFEFAVPKSMNPEKHRLHLEVNYQSAAELSLEAYTGSEYVPVGVLAPTDYCAKRFSFEYGKPVERTDKSSTQPQAVELPGHKEPDFGDSAAQRTPDEYGSGAVKITNVRMLDHMDRESRVFLVGRPVKVVIAFETHRMLENPVFVFCAYLSDGQCASQWVVSAEQLGQRFMDRPGEVAFHVDKLLMGRGSYIASAAIFKELRKDGLEGESYHVLDRCIHFQILQDVDDQIERGLCLQPFEATLNTFGRQQCVPGLERNLSGYSATLSTPK